MDEKESNIIRIEGLKADFESALEMGWLVEARAALSDIEEMGVDTLELENRVKEAEREHKDFLEEEQEKWNNLQQENEYFRNIQFGVDSIW